MQRQNEMSLILDKFGEFKQRLLNRKPHDKWEFALSFIGFFYKLVCCPITERHFQIHWYYWFLGFVVCDAYICMTYAAIIAFPDTIRCVEAVYTIGITAAVRINYITTFIIFH